MALFLRSTIRRLNKLHHTSVRCYSSSKTPSMKQIDVDEPVVQRELGNLEMTFIRKADQENYLRANRHLKIRRKNIIALSICLLIIFSIYGYTIYAIKQEDFLDDFDPPELLQEYEDEDDEDDED